jgi:uncharacterized protein (TIGR02453 family)
MDTKAILEFLRALQANNSVEWMKENRAYAQDAKESFEKLLQELIWSISDFDATILYLNPKDLIFRLNRDLRFGSDKTPYNPSFRAHISAAGRMPIPCGYYINIKPGNCFLGGGIFASDFSDATARVRAYLTEHGDDFLKIISGKAFAESFTVTGVKLKNIPAGYEKDHPLAEYLKHKSWAIQLPITDERFSAIKTIVPYIAEKFKLMKPFNDYLNNALADFKMPMR